MKIERFTSDYPTTPPDGQTRRSTRRYTMLATRMIQVTADAQHHTVREYEPLDFVTAQEREELKAFQGVFKQNSNGTVTASNYVGVITTKRGTVIEILPKIDLGSDSEPDHEKTKRLFLPMLRCWRGFGEKTLRESDIRTLRRFPMLEVFVRQFLVNLNTLTRGGLARRYIPVEENLPYLGGRILFHEQIRENLINHARFYVSHDELSVNRPSNRLIHSTMAKLIPLVRNTENRRLLHQLMTTFADVPKTANPHADWQQHHVGSFHAALRAGDAVGASVSVRAWVDDFRRTPSEPVLAVPHGAGV